MARIMRSVVILVINYNRFTLLGHRGSIRLPNNKIYIRLIDDEKISLNNSQPRLQLINKHTPTESCKKETITLLIYGCLRAISFISPIGTFKL